MPFTTPYTPDGTTYHTSVDMPTDGAQGTAAMQNAADEAALDNAEYNRLHLPLVGYDKNDNSTSILHYTSGATWASQALSIQPVVGTALNVGDLAIVRFSGHIITDSANASAQVRLRCKLNGGSLQTIDGAFTNFGSGVLQAAGQVYPFSVEGVIVAGANAVASVYLELIGDGTHGCSIYAPYCAVFTSHKALT